MNQINYSIIIPHRNIPKLLQRCLDSIPRRDDVQIIVVDDNSEPEKVDFDHFPGLNDPHIEVIFTKEGKGAGYARNVGLKKAVGKWLLFADADDYYNYCINDILNEYVNSDTELIYFMNNSLDSDMYTATGRGSHFNVYIDYWLYSPQKAEGLLRYKHNDTVWAKLFKREMVEKNTILFDETSISNDNTFAYLTGYHAKSVSADPRAMYCNTVRKGSLRYGKLSAENKFDLFCVDSKRYLFFHEHKVPMGKKGIFINIMTKWYFFNKAQYKKAKAYLLKLGFTSGQLFGLCLKNAIVFIPKKIVREHFHEYGLRKKLSKRK